MIQTKQSTSIEKPLEKDKNICLSISCPKCKTGRIFKIDLNLKLVQNREKAWFGIHTFCEKCDSEISVNIGWFDDSFGYSYRKLKYYEEKSDTVEDENGLAEMHD